MKINNIDDHVKSNLPNKQEIILLLIGSNENLYLLVYALNQLIIVDTNCIYIEQKIFYE